MNKIQPPSIQSDLTTNSESTPDEQICSATSIVILSRDLGDHIKKFLTGKEIACLNTSCSTLNHISWLSKHRIKEEQCVIKYTQSYRLHTLFPKINLKIVMGDFKDALELIEQLPPSEGLTNYHKIAKIPTTHPHLRKIIKKLNYEGGVGAQASFSLLKYKLNPDNENFEKTKAFIQKLEPSKPPYAHQLMRQLLFEQAKQECNGEDLKIRLQNVFEEYLKAWNPDLPLSIIFNLENDLIETLIEMGESAAVLKCIQKLEDIIENHPNGLVQALKRGLFLKIANIKAKISFDRALETVKKATVKGPVYYKDFLLDFLIASPSQKISLDSLSILGELPCSKEEEESKALAVWTLIVQGKIPEVDTISQNITNIDLSIITLVWCARALEKTALNLAIKYLQKAMDLLLEKQYFLKELDRITTLTKILAFSRKITS